jgi:ABC-type dipeptide/oligopeptide/nickel transport system permease subunit
MPEATAELPVEAPLERTPASPWRVALRRLLRKRLALTALVLVTIFYLVGLLAPVLAPQDYRDQDLNNTLQAPSQEHLLGTDRLGRDMLSRVIWSARTTIIVTVATVVTGSLVLAVGLGMLSGYAGGKTDTAIMRAGEAFASLPGLPLLILINTTMRFRAKQSVDWLESHISSEALQDAIEAHSGPEFVFLALLGLLAIVGLVGLAAWLAAGEERRRGAWLVPGVVAAFVILSLWLVQGIFATGGAEDYFLIFGALSLFSWVGGARVIRSQVLALRETEYILAAQAMGAGTWRVIMSHLLPNVSPIIIVSVSAGLGAIAGTEIALTFLGVGIHEPTPSFGALIFEASNLRTIENYPHLLLAPAIVVAMLIFAFNLLGDALNDVLTPRAR